jgi:hypothetical protein
MWVRVQESIRMPDKGKYIPFIMPVPAPGDRADATAMATRA